MELHDGMYAEYERLADDVRDIQRRMTEIRATADSADGLISVTVGAGGELIELWLDPRIYRHPDSEALADDITDTIRRAALEAKKLGFAVVEEFLPADASVETAELGFDPFLHALDKQTGRA
ncbi:YbaB/EbfC family nucleoid-associated protein [Actinokineospora sp. HUAS TT18]|uniref:YbaB/EbfC family nucleoid-associated protein n=1 Tax=Actinokineospora sp. HUAS TT18 TaxID=3447451 RepID=UPI003F51DFC6